MSPGNQSQHTTSMIAYTEESSHRNCEQRWIPDINLRGTNKQYIKSKKKKVQLSP
jgi:hypothetical protein